MSDSEQDMKRVEEAVRILEEHFDTIQVFATRHEAGEKDGTVNINLGSGNWFARYGQVKEWCVRVEEDTRISRRKDET